MRTAIGDQIVDWYMAIACDKAMPEEVRLMARDKLRAFALREPHQTVEDIDDKPAN